jgi:2',3'-cyclic-nucleotide 2'-phosphodiesterase (5'-nucleotidase family)
LKASFTCNGTTPAITGMWLAPDGPTGALTPIGPADTVRLVTNDFMLTGGDGYTVLTEGTDVAQPGDALLDIVVDHFRANSPVNPAIPTATCTGPDCRLVQE